MPWEHKIALGSTPLQHFNVLTNTKANPRSRSRLTIKDLDTKIGTLVNGEQIRGKTHPLDRVENEVVLGRFKDRFL